MRIKPYYTEDEIVNGLYTMGGEYETDDHVEYIGPYHRYTGTNEVYTESKWNIRLSTPLRLYTVLPQSIKTYNTLKTVPVTGFESITNTIATIKLSDITNGYVTRYFCKKRNSDDIIEIDEIQYTKWLAGYIDRIMYDAVTVNWKITGPLNDSMQNHVYIPGVLSYNRTQLIQAQDILPTILTYVTDYAQFYVDNDFSVPTDINGLDS